MIFRETPLAGAYMVEPERRGDDRGWFARTFAAEDFKARGLNPAVVHCNASYNANAGTLRGLHFQTAPHAEAKLVRCTRGDIYDVIVDLRPGSETFCRWFAAELGEASGVALYVPEGFAHGFQTLAGETEVLYQMSHQYEPTYASGVRWNDPAFGIEWPDTVERTMSERDAAYPDFSP